MPFTYKKLKDKKENEYIEITGYDGKIKHLNIPSEIEGLPVKSIARSAFSGRDDIAEIIVPQSVYAIKAYAFYNCKNLKVLRLYNSVEDFYDGVIKLCTNLVLVEITQICSDRPYSVMKDILSDTDRQISFMIREIDSSDIYLTFPSYVYEYVDDDLARAIHVKIHGCGYAYRECVTRTHISFTEYDNIFSRVKYDDFAVATEIALDRLSSGVSLFDRHLEEYKGFIKSYGGEVLELIITGYCKSPLTGDKASIDAWRLRESVEAWIEYLCKENLLDIHSVDKGIELSSSKGMSIITSMLIDYKSTLSVDEKTSKLDLLDW